ncbi:family 2 glycosyltransferase [Cryphonectria parasitica EP155]|uniref:Family 2 glycosyltransferase n=1 Tax=Cryphonectria parasitica (strain ATCC 38755 / EP155) TaxID=660469 RepID=A0A9P4XZ33_CRYP1|nr:family 2 glycosyltransferase [Cryphonectria parasitica EP155]KAF3763185.1 family 2 glycosyltransferase [Cryphonectria parasitica EP155]
MLLEQEDGTFVLNTASPRHVPVWKQCLHVFCCLVSLPLYFLMTVSSQFPITLDLLMTIILTELNRFVNERRRQKSYKFDNLDASPIREKEDWLRWELNVEKTAPRLDCMAAVVGWREHPDLFHRALESYKVAQGCTFILVGIDGDEIEDQDMVDVFNKATVIHLDEPLGEIAERTRAKLVAIRQQDEQPMDDADIDKMVMQHLIQLARNILDQHRLTIGGGSYDGIRHLCIRQRHMHKKGIMFSTFVFSLVIADILGIEFLWSSDSDTIVFPDSLSRTIDTIAADPNIGGASSGLVVHNGDETRITRLAATVYWGELYLTRSTTAATATSDCQSGPSTVFRLSALPNILVPWYLQTIMGKRMIINEDRHLTTNLLLRGWGVVYASDVLTATDTPTTMNKWLKQQLRWARATHIESLLMPKVYLKTNPLLFFGMAKREVGPVLAAVAVVHYLITSRSLVPFSSRDIGMRLLFGIVYNVLRNPDRLGTSGWAARKWVLPGILFYYIPLPAVHVWSMLTLTADGWGTAMRAEGETAPKPSGAAQPKNDMGFFIVWMGILAAATAKCLGHHHGLGSLHTGLLMMSCISLVVLVAWRVTKIKA